MIFDNHVDSVRFRELGEPAQAIGGQLDLVFIGAAAAGVDPDRVTAEIGGGLNPFLMSVDGSGAARFLRVAEGALTVETRDLDDLCRRLPALVGELRAGIKSLESSDASLEAVFDYLVD